MKRKLLTLFAACIMAAAPVYADGDDNKTVSTDKPIWVKINPPIVPGNPGRPKAPSKQHIECWYCDGELSFDFVIPEGECTLFLTDYSI